MITIQLREGSTWVFYRSGAHRFETERSAMEWVVKLQLGRPELQVKVEAA